MSNLPYSTSESASAWFRSNANVNDWEDCDACCASDDMCPVHFGMEIGIQRFSRVISRIAADPELTNHIPAHLLYGTGDSGA